MIERVAVLDVLPRVPVMISLTAPATGVVLIVNVAVVAPAATTTFAGTVALVSLADSVTVVPPVGAAPSRVTVPVEVLPPTTDVGETDTLTSAGGLIVSVPVLVVEPCVPVMVAVVIVATGVVLTVNVAEVAPAAMVTVAGRVALGVFEERLTTVPPGPAGPFRVAVPVEGFPPVTAVGARVMLVRLAGLIVSVAVFVVLASVPEIVAVAVLETAKVLIVNVALVAPAATVTVAGTVALRLSDERVMTAPEGPAAPVRVAVPVEVLVPTTAVGDTEMLCRVAGKIVKVAVLLTLPRLPVIVTDVELDTGVVVIVKVADVAPAGIVTDAGADAFGTLEDSMTLTPPVGAAPSRVAVPVELVPP